MKIAQNKIVKWSIVVGWMFVIFCFSAQNADESSALSGGIAALLTDLVQRIFSVDITQNAKLIFFVRKTAHFSIYFVLGLLVSGALRDETIDWKKVLTALVICFIYACSDEFHQYFVPGRSCSFRDVCIDTCGALVGILLWKIAIQWKNGYNR